MAIGHPATDGRFVPDNQRLERCSQEPAAQHRGLLLYCMMDPHRRSYRRVAVAAGRQDGSIRNWAARWLWAERMAREGVTTQARACQIYRELYYAEHGPRDISVIEDNMSVSVLVAAPPPNAETGVGDETRAQVTKALAPSASGHVESNPLAVAALKLDRFANLAEAVIGGFSRDVQKALQSQDPNAFRKMGVRPGDIPRFVKMWHDLQEVRGGLAPAPAAHPSMETSFRVQHALRTGGSTARAHLEDAQEVVAVLQSLISAEEAEAEVRTRAPHAEPALALVGEAGEADEPQSQAG